MEAIETRLWRAQRSAFSRMLEAERAYFEKAHGSPEEERRLSRMKGIARARCRRVERLLGSVLEIGLDRRAG